LLELVYECLLRSRSTLEGSILCSTVYALAVLAKSTQMNKVADLERKLEIAMETGRRVGAVAPGDRLDL